MELLAGLGTVAELGECLDMAAGADAGYVAVIVLEVTWWTSEKVALDLER